jgi:curved DNA-binding protein CbpA
MTRPDRDPYDVLGISPQASASEVSRAYRRAARATHPDNHPDDPSAAEQFRDLAAAYEILGSPDRRAAHDRGARVVHVVVRRGSPTYTPPVRLGPYRPAADPAHPGHASKRVEAWPRLRSPVFDANGAGWRPGSPTYVDDPLLNMAAEMLRRLRMGRF